MGGAASTINFANIKLTEKECKTVMKELFERQVFDALADSDSLVSIDSLNTYYTKRTDVFLTHDWGKELGVDNHERVGRINEALKKRGLSTWFDSEKMEGNVKKKMISGIENANCIVVFVTKRYMDKVSSDNAEDNCQLEFNYASRRKTARKMVPVVMEARVRDTSQWMGEVGMVLGGNLYVDLATDDSFEARMDELYSRVLEVTGTSLKKVMEGKELIEMINSKSHDVAAVAASTAVAAVAAPPAETPTPASSPDKVLTSKEQAMITTFQDWIVENTDIVPNFASKYAATLVEKGVGSVEKLKKKLVKNPNYLGDLGFDEDDAEEITLVALGRKQKHPEENKVVEREFKDLIDYFMVACWKGTHGRSELEAASEDVNDEERSMIATALLAVAWYKGEGQFTKEEEMYSSLGGQAFEWLQSRSLEPTDDLISASSVEPKPYALSTIATTLTAYLLRDGIGVDIDARLAAQYMKAAAPYGNLISQFLLGYALCEGEGLDEQDDERGIQFYRLAAAQGHPTALYNLGVQYLNGEGVQKDETEAAMFFKRAAACGYASACAEYGESLYFGRGVAQDQEEGFRYLSEAYERGEKSACYLLAFYYLNGDGGVEVDRLKAREMMEIAKDLGAERAIDSWEGTFKDIEEE